MINTLKHLAFVLKADLSEFENILSQLDKYYYQKVEVKTDKNGAPKLKNGVVQNRVLNPSISRLKILQKRILKNILQKLEMPDYAYGSIKGKDNIGNAKRHQGKKYIFTTDLRNFFPSITNKMVFQMFRSFDYSPTVSKCLTELTTYKGKLPQGAPTSPMIANLVFIKTGKQLDEFAKNNGITFTSLIDDLTFSAPYSFKEKAPFIIDALIKDGFKISHNKTNYKTKFPIVTGIVVKNNSLDITEAFKIKMTVIEGKSEAQIKGMERYASRVKSA